MSMADIRLKEIGIDPNAKAGTSDAAKVAAFQRQLFLAMNAAEEEKGRRLNDDETFGLIKSLTKEVVQKGWLWDSKTPSFIEMDKAQSTSGATGGGEMPEEVPTEERAQIIEALQKYGKPVTEENILLNYLVFNKLYF